ncbi:MAG: hypothetical protein HGB26_01515 [Desulfobulbaceae bacterium]|nr:hypothetical protein [Desulfobulbaceae bacterium]
MLTVDLLKEKFGVKEDQELAVLLGKSPAAISKWRNSGEIPALAERQAAAILQKGPYTTAIHGDNNHIAVHQVADPLATDYSPATATLLDIMKEWSERKRRMLLGKAIEMNGDEPEEG